MKNKQFFPEQPVNYVSRSCCRDSTIQKYSCRKGMCTGTGTWIIKDIGDAGSYWGTETGIKIALIGNDDSGDTCRNRYK